MGCTVNCVGNAAMCFVILGIGAQIAGVLTDYWCAGSRDEEKTGNETNFMSKDVYMGLHRQFIEYGNGTVIETESSLNLREEQYIALAIAGANGLLCLILCIKSIDIIFGIASFIVMTLMLLFAFYSFEHTAANMDKLQMFYSTWPPLSLSWSFFLVFCGLVVNIVSSAVFLSLLLYKGERKAAKATKSFERKQKETQERHEYENTAFIVDGRGNLDPSTSGPDVEQTTGGHPVTYTELMDKSVRPENNYDEISIKDQTEAQVTSSEPDVEYSVYENDMIGSCRL